MPWWAIGWDVFCWIMTSFELGLFAGGDNADLPRDNLDLERWFRQPKGHERRIHGRCPAGVRIVQEGPTLVLALDAHHRPPSKLNGRQQATCFANIGPVPFSPDSATPV